jgi:hypothetical protein
MTMIECPFCKFQNPDNRSYCVKCLRRLVPPGGGSEDELEEILVKRDAEIERLRKELESMHGNHPVLHSLQTELEAREVEQQKGLQDLSEARKIAPALPSYPGAKLVIESHPIKKLHYHIEVDRSTKSIDLAATEYRIRATLERTADGLEIFVHNGANVNVLLSEKNARWKRCFEGDRIKVSTGAIIYDPKGAMNARLSEMN